MLTLFMLQYDRAQTRSLKICILLSFYSFGAQIQFSAVFATRFRLYNARRSKRVFNFFCEIVDKMAVPELANE